MRPVNVLFFALILLSYTSCKPEEVDKSDSIDLYSKCQVDTSLISNYLKDLTLVLKREGDYSLQPFLAYRRLEALSNQVFDLDHLGYVFYNDLHNSDTLNKKVNEWIDWLGVEG